MKAKIYTLDKGEAGEIDLADEIFAVAPRRDILHRVVTWQLAKRRAGTQSTKTVAMVQGSTRKIYKQKGTGRARHGQIRAAQFRKGGVALGPLPRSHAIDLPKKIRRLGLKCALSAKAAEGKLVVVDSLKTEPKTKALKGRLDKFGFKSALFIDGAAVEDSFARAVRNLDGFDALPTVGANVYDILRRDGLVLTKAAVEGLKERLS
ncbi:MAG: 50S ribosomal protein L4 [Alphaproteobacteria bacterium]|nr:50S ribosomal protein L4 [Alphaproteobacteria bacterium]